MCESVLHFLMMIKDYSVSKVLKTALYYTETKENAMNLVATHYSTVDMASNFIISNVLPSPNIYI